LAPAPAPAAAPAPAPAKTPAAPHEPAETPAPATINVSNVATKSEAVTISLRQIHGDITGDRTVPRIAEQLPALTAEIDARLDETTTLLQSASSIGPLGALEEDWSTIKLGLDDWGRRLDERLTALSDDQKYLAVLAGPWNEGLAYAKDRAANGSTPDLRARNARAAEQIQSVIDQIDAAKAEVRSQVLAVVELRADLDLQAARTLSVLDSVRRAREQQFDRLFCRDSPAVWQLHGWTDTGLLRQGDASLERQVRAVWAYVQRRRDQVYFQALVAVALAAGLFWARRAVRRWAEDDPNLLAAKPAFASPLATALVLSFVVGVWLYPQAPRLFWAAVGALALVPTVIILRRLIDRRLFPVLDALVVFYFVDQIRTVVAAIPLVARVLFLAEMLAATGLMISIVFTRDTGPDQSRFAKLVRFGLRLWLAVLAVVVAANVVGYVSLSELVGSAALAGAYLAVIFYAGTLVLSGIIVIGLRSRPIVLLGMIKRFQPVILRRIILSLQWIAMLGWALSMLELLSVRSAVYWFLHALWNKQLVIGSLRFAPLHILGFGLTIWLAFLVSRFIRFVLCQDVYDRLPIASGLSYAINRMVHYLVLLGGFYLAVTALGMDVSQFTFLSAAFGLGIGFGMQNIFNNFVSGLIILFERPIKVGDVIDLDDTSGVVNHIGIRASIIRTADSSEIIVPNGSLISSRVTNWTLSNRQRGITIPVSVGSQSDPTAVMDLLKRVAASNPLVTRLPRPQAYLIKFGQDSFSYELHVWTDVAEQWIQIRSDVSVAVHEELNKQNIPIR
jgi:small-conductance mechanosensitive channel